jgi:glycosyltransferase involved in cell wall biosynthesis
LKYHQITQGSCRARNEAIALCVDYIVFGDDDIRIPPDFIENHIRLLQTYNASACNGLISERIIIPKFEDLQKDIGL